ncbi:MAG: FAD/NAD(P)-binding protein [Acidobacteriia bacterium]|nr:FAD/NAD(P)-binding protein [Terriglobia bacterium]
MSPTNPDPMVPTPFRVQRVRQETHDTFTLELEPARGGNGFSFQAGQFNMLYVFGVGEVPISISGDPTRSKMLVHTTRAVGTVTKAMRRLKRGDILGVRGPFGSHWPVEVAAGSDVVIVAGGIGLAPLRPAMYELLSRRDQYDKVVLLYGARTPEEILFPRELERWRAHFDLEVHVTVDRAMGGWRGNVGVVTTLIQKAPFNARSTTAMVCGPEVMMRFTVMELLKRGVKTDNIHISMERNMKCAIGFCGHCQFGPVFVCKDGPVFVYGRIKDLLTKWEI